MKGRSHIQRLDTTDLINEVKKLGIIDQNPRRSSSDDGRSLSIHKWFRQNPAESNHLSTPLGETVWGTIDMKNPLIAYALCSDQAPI